MEGVPTEATLAASHSPPHLVILPLPGALPTPLYTPKGGLNPGLLPLQGVGAAVPLLC